MFWSINSLSSVVGWGAQDRNHRAAVALHFAWYNFCQIHGSLKITPAMEAGITHHVWSVKELLATMCLK
jgi:hypothetical protein